MYIYIYFPCLFVYVAKSYFCSFNEIRLRFKMVNWHIYVLCFLFIIFNHTTYQKSFNISHIPGGKLLSCPNLKVLYNLGKYLVKAFK